ncbi:MAG: hypothetical protein BMS9Abin07_0220 [Acidimicrobiia bacterium]|nr:MAG: hypothetical protein BMS9Abin07_0220 [Acidimicrobiia bacterium]
MTFVAQLGTGDCEAIRQEWLKQPTNAWSSVAFAVVGLAVLTSARSVDGAERTDRVVFGLLLTATGIGSFLFHGLQPGPANFLHDITLLAALLFLVVVSAAGAFAANRHTVAAVFLGGVAVFALALLVSPGITNVLTGIVIILLIASDVAMWRRTEPNRSWYAGAGAVLVAALALNFAGRTDAPWCDSTTLLQPHAGWHVLAAVFLGLYFMATAPAREKSETGVS